MREQYINRRATNGRARLMAIAASAAFVAPSILFWPGTAAALTDLELLGKNVFFDRISKPEDQQACASCHDQAKGGTLPNSVINKTSVTAPGAKANARGGVKPPNNAYAFFAPPFAANAAAFPAGFEGGNFWDGRAEGFGALGSPVPVGDPAKTSDTVRLDDIPLSKQGAYAKYLGPTADQALNPFPNPVEQNIRIKRVCTTVRDASYSYLYTSAFGEPIKCGAAFVNTSYKRLALSLAAYQASSEISSFSSKRDKELKKKGSFPLPGFTDQENLGHDIFYGLNDTGRNRVVTNPLPFGPPVVPLSANCAICHLGTPAGPLADPQGVDPKQIYTDSRYHSIGVPYNPEIRLSSGASVAKGAIPGLSDHVTGSATATPGHFKTPTLRNVGKGASSTFTKAYMHNGYFKSLKRVVHFYNTRDSLPKCDTDLGIIDATDVQAQQNTCWPTPEFPASAAVTSIFIGNIGLTDAEEDALVAYLLTLSDTVTPTAPVR